MERIFERINEIHESESFINCAVYFWPNRNEKEKHKRFLERKLTREFDSSQVDKALSSFFEKEENSKEAIANARLKKHFN